MPAAKSDLIDRYLHAVKFWLPKAQQQDILAELAEDLHSQVDEREAALGHSLDEANLAAILLQRGAPMRVASGYLPEQRLINPALLPVYRLILKIALLWVLAPLFLIVFLGPAFTSAHPERVLLLFWAEAWRTGFMVVGMVTVVFALIDRYDVKFKNLDSWDPRKLPRVPAAQETSARWNRLGEFICGMLFAVGWVYFFWQRSEFTFPGGVRVILGPVWKYIYWPVLSLALTGSSIDLLSFLYPCWMKMRPRLRLGMDALVILMAGLLFKVDNWVEVAAPNVSAADMAKAMPWVNLSMHITMGFIAFVTLVDAVQQLRSLLRGKPATGAPILTA